MKKNVSVELIGDAKEAYEKLNSIVGQQKQEGKIKSDELTLWNGIQRIFDLIQHNPFYGENAKKNLIPEFYKKQYNVTNLFIADLPLYWRMIYTLESDKVEIVAFILDIYTHEEYDKRFGFRKK